MTVYGIVAAAVIGTAGFLSIQSANGGTDIRTNLSIIAPGSVGGGNDTFAREQQQAMRQSGLVANAQVVNIPGAGGTIGLTQLATMTGQANVLMNAGTVMLGAIELNDSPTDMSDVTPIARVAEEYNVVVVPTDAPFNTLDEMIAAWKVNPKAFPFTGGSAGSIDQLLIAQLGLKVGIDPSQITYIPKTGGGEALQSLLAGTAKALSTGYGEVADQIEAGRVKAIGLAAPQRFEGVDIPTFAEQGYATDMTNWRGIVAPPGITAEERAALQELVKETSETPEWAETVKLYYWNPVYLDGPEFEKFLKEDQARIAGLIKELDL
ncbi:tripartite tricarboxylate transporter substrate binding protein [Arthrobacter sp. RT-1]|uniref:tripartite tricarboxylate transporter substrate binding protein n=1 Tax=Arthrobacter sp. RT-1 TaxID=2292263 RepID=UPI000E1F336A|nr:tripartite tricarboxylate transporter substrate-binding protein [Arthrobacter sp. RT-1]RDV12271.1 tripartite tricarboxylate transporter substrate binding protein [Arthrobacter sp. RT-1]